MNFSVKKTVMGSLLAVGLIGGMAHAQQAPGPVPAPAAAAALNDVQAAIQQAERQAQDAEKRSGEANAERIRKMRELRAREPRTPEERDAMRKARAEARQKEMAEMTPEVRAARQKEIQARRAQMAAIRAAKEAHAGAEVSAKNLAKLNGDLDAVHKPNAARGADFTPQNVTPLLQGVDNLTKRLAAIKAPADLNPQQLGQLEQTMGQLKSYMDRVDDALVGVQRAGVQTPANKEAEALYNRVGDMAKAMDAEMQRVEKLFPTTPAVRAAFAKFRD